MVILIGTPLLKFNKKWHGIGLSTVIYICAKNEKILKLHYHAVVVVRGKLVKKKKKSHFSFELLLNFIQERLHYSFNSTNLMYKISAFSFSNMAPSFVQFHHWLKCWTIRTLSSGTTQMVSFQNESSMMRFQAIKLENLWPDESISMGIINKPISVSVVNEMPVYRFSLR